MLRRWLVGLVGIRHDLLDETPVDWFRYVALAGVLLTTAGIATVSAAFAMQMALHLPIAWAILVGIGWGAVILNLDRALVIGMVRRASFWRNMVAAIPRLALAVLLGVVISTPLVLRIFQPEIDAEMQLQQQDRKTTFQERLASNTRFKEIDALTKQLEDKNKIARKDPTAIDLNQSVIDAQARVDKDKAAVQDAQEKYNCEVDGTCGTKREGFGDASSTRLDTLNAAKQALSDAEDFLATERAKASASLDDEAPVAAAQAAGIQADLTSRLADKQRAIDDESKLEDHNTGLLARLEALNALTESRPDLGRAQLLLFLLFLTIEVLPVGVKLLYLSTPKTLYEKFSEDLETAADRSMSKSLSRYENVIDAFGEMRADLEYDQLNHQREAGLRINQLLIDEQTTMAEQAVPRFARDPNAPNNGRAVPDLFSRLRWSKLYESLNRHTPDRRTRRPRRD